MKKRAPIQTSENLVRAFGEFFNEMEPETAESIEAELRDAGYDPDEVGKRMKAVAEQAIAESPLNWKNGYLENIRLRGIIANAIIRLGEMKIRPSEDCAIASILDIRESLRRGLELAQE